MFDRQLQPLLAQTVTEVLETMFFTAPLGPCEEETGGTALEARLHFRGALPGSFSVRISEAAARNLAAGFLGEDNDALGARQIEQVIRELANMLCGSLVSKLEREEPFELDPPELLGAASAEPQGNPPAAQQSFAIEDGALTLSLHLDGPA